MTLIRWPDCPSVPQHHRAWRRRSVRTHVNEIAREREWWSKVHRPRRFLTLSASLLPLWWGTISRWTIMVAAIILLLVIVVGQRQQIKRSGSILISCHYKGTTRLSSHTVAEPVLRTWWLTPLLLQPVLWRWNNWAAAWIQSPGFMCLTPPFPHGAPFSGHMIERPLVSALLYVDKQLS